jgi:hypothetical protein
MVSAGMGTAVTKKRQIMRETRIRALPGGEKWVYHV